VPDKPFLAGERVSVRALVARPERTPDVLRLSRCHPVPDEGLPGFPTRRPPRPPTELRLGTNLHPRSSMSPLPIATPAAGAVMMTVGPGPGEYGPVIYSPQGRLIWFDNLPGGQRAEPQRAALRRSARPHLVAGTRVRLRVRQGQNS